MNNFFLIVNLSVINLINDDKNIHKFESIVNILNYIKLFL